MIFIPHFWLITILINQLLTAHFHFGNRQRAILFGVDSLLVLIYLCCFLYLQIMPVKDKSLPSLRLKIMEGGRRILRFCCCGIIVQILVWILLFQNHFHILPSPSDDRLKYLMIAMDLFFCFLHFYLLILNGSIRILCTCRSLGVWKRILIICFLWIPILHLFPLKYLCRRGKEELLAETCRFENQLERDGSLACATKYPLILLHGIGFRDFKYFNYWGRIPKALVRNGAIVYYGHQEAFGTIENNGEMIKKKIEEVLAENHCNKVNLIAHSKGGLDARYLISGLHMEEKVASLTTISTPHRGSELLNILNKLPDKIYHFIAALFDRSFGRIGDAHPDCYHSSKQLSPEFCKAFNEKYPDAPGVFYQSYTSIVKHTLGDTLLSVPNLLMFFAGAPANDGLVSVESAKWGTFKGTFTSSGKRGISHGDMIDLKREDYKGFDVIEAYIQIVAELKERGF